MSATHSQRIAIIGAGPVGLACATFLARCGHHISVFEQAAQPGPTGAGLLLQPTGMLVLEQLGVLPTMLRHGAPIARLYGTDRRWPVMNLEYRRWHPNAFGLGVHRGLLWQVLEQAAQTAGAQIIPNHNIVRIDQRPRSVLLHAEQPSVATAEPFDLCIVAAGAFASIRAQTGVSFRVRPYHWGALWTVVRNPTELFCTEAQQPRGVLRQWYKGAQQMLGLMPAGRLLSDNASTPPWITVYWSLPNSRAAHWQQEFPAHHAAMLKLAPEAASLLAGITTEQMTYARYADVHVPNPVSPTHQRVIVLGDCAHATSPQLGQGANLGLLDAYVLQACLQNFSVEEAGQQFAARRQQHWHYVRSASRFLTPFFQSDSTLAAWARNVCLPIACKIPPVHHDMTSTLVGVKTGWLTGRLNEFKTPPNQ